MRTRGSYSALISIPSDMNAPKPLRISTYDGSGQCVHPDVAHIPGGFAGYEYWMAMTPYPYAKDRLENPSLRASHDGYSWEAPPGSPDPLIAAPDDPDEHHADTDVVYAGRDLYVFYMTTNECDRQTRFSYVKSSDGRRWSAPIDIYRGAFGVSPAVVHRDDRWNLWYVDYDSDARAESSRLFRLRGRALEALSDKAECTLLIPDHVVWHIDVICSGDGWEALVVAYPRGSTSSRCRVFHATSTDGVRFVLTRNSPLLRPSRFGWDNRIIYRSTLLKKDDQKYRVWYTGGSWSRTWGIGYLEGALDSLAPSPLAPSSQARKNLLSDLIGMLRYGLGRVLPTSWVTALRRRMRAPHS
jgi:hypothetical protein